MKIRRFKLDIKHQNQTDKLVLPIFFIAVLVVSFLLPTVFNGRAYLYGDNLSHQFPTLTFYKQEVLRGRIPLWNPYILGGVPYLADPTHNTFAPTNLFYLIFPIHVGMMFNLFFFLFIAEMFTYLYVHELTNKKMPALISAVIFTFSGSMLSEINDLNSLQGIALMPLVIFSMTKLVKKKNSTNVFLV